MCQRIQFLVLAFVAIQFAPINRISFVSAGITSLIVTADLGMQRNRTYYEPEVTDSSKFGTISIPANVAFFILQVHSFDKLVALSSSKDFKEFVIGTDFGFLQYVPPNPLEIYFEFFIKDFGKSADYVVSLVTYGESDPIPGGCNNDLQPVPHQNVFYDDDVVTVEFQQASVLNNCEENDVNIEMYYLPFDYTYNKTSYFNIIRKMATVEDIKANGIKVAHPLSDLRQSYVNYVGVGRVFGTIAYWNNYTTAYVSIVSYGCSFNTENCQEGNDIATTFAIFYILIGVTALLRLEKSTAFLCTITCVIHIIVPFQSHGFSILTFTICLAAIVCAGIALYYLDCRDINLVILCYVIGCWVVSTFSGFGFAQTTIFYWLFHVISCVLFWMIFSVYNEYDLVLNSTIFLLSFSFALSLLNGTHLNHIILNNKFYFTTKFHQPVVTDMIYKPKDIIIVFSLLAVIFLYGGCHCILQLQRRRREVAERTPLIPAS